MLSTLRLLSSKERTNRYTGGGVILVSKCSRQSLHQNKHPHMPFCEQCEAILNENPLGALLRRDDLGNLLLCAPCRKLIYRANDDVKYGYTSFTFVNPAKHRSEDSATLCATSATGNAATAAASSAYAAAADTCAERWFCTRCRSAIFAMPRAFEGDDEPEDWWWCRTCQKEYREAGKVPKGSGVHVCVAKKDAHDQSQQKLDKWFMGHTHTVL